MASYPHILSPTEQSRYGIPAPVSFAVSGVVVFSELDPLNHVNNIAYARWCETARVAYLLHYGMTRYHADDPRFVIRNFEIAYLSEMHLHDEYMVTAHTTALRHSSFTLAHEIWSGGRITAQARAVMVQLHPIEAAKMPLAPDIRQRLIERDGAVAQ